VIAGAQSYNYPRLVNVRRAKILKASGNIFIIGALALFPLDVLWLHHLRAQPDYHDPTDGEREVLATYLCMIIGIGVGCVFLWVASRFGKSKEVSFFSSFRL
jgi:hypothetical protein